MDPVPSSLVVDRDGVVLHVMSWDPASPDPDLPAFLLVHGLASNAQLWSGAAAQLAAAGHRVVAVDQRGHGLSARADDGYDFATLTDDLVAVVDALELGRPVAVGQSWGGNVVLELAVRHGDRVTAIACVDGGHIDLATEFSDHTAMLAALTPPGLAGMPLADLREGLRRRHPDWPDTGIRGQLANFARRPDGTVGPHLTLERHLAILDHLWQHHPVARWEQVPVPALLLPVRDRHGPVGSGPEPDARRRAVEAVAAANDRVRVTWLHGDHDVHAQHPALVADLLRAFVDDPTRAPQPAGSAGR